MILNLRSQRGGVILNQEITDNTVVFKVRNIGLLSYPIGSVYQSTKSTNPANIFGGNWSQIKDKFLLACGDIYSNGSTGGEANHILTVEETPAHTHTRGTMNITGNVTPCDTNYFWGAGTNASGAFVSRNMTASHIGANTWTGTRGNGFDFDASRTWTGETSSIGGNQPHNNMPPYFAIYIWYRTA